MWVVMGPYTNLAVHCYVEKEMRRHTTGFGMPRRIRLDDLLVDDATTDARLPERLNRAGKLRADGVEGRLNLCSDARHRHNCHKTDQAGNECVLDQALAGFVLQQGSSDACEILHLMFSSFGHCALLLSLRRDAIRAGPLLKEQ
jgi:hypothetical protein